MLKLGYDNPLPEIYWDNGCARRAYNDPLEVFFDTRLEIDVGFERAYASYERDMLLATERKAKLDLQARDQGCVVKTTKTTNRTVRKSALLYAINEV